MEKSTVPSNDIVSFMAPMTALNPIDATQEKVAGAMAAQLDLYLTRILAKSS